MAKAITIEDYKNAAKDSIDMTILVGKSLGITTDDIFETVKNSIITISAVAARLFDVNPYDFKEELTDFISK